MSHTPGKTSPSSQPSTLNPQPSTVFIIFAALLCLGAGETAPSPTNRPAPVRKKIIERLELQPKRVIYQQVEAIVLKSPNGVFVDPTTGEVYVADTKNDLVAVYNQDGIPLFAFGYNGEFKEPQRVVCDPQGRIYVLTGVPRQIKVFTYRGEYLRDFPFTGFDVEPEPNALAVDGQGNLYIADAASRQILVFDPEYRLKLAFGEKGDGSSHFQSVKAMTVDRDGNIYVADARATPAIQVFSPEGKFLRGWGEHASGPQNFSLPAGLAIDGEGRVIVVDTLRHTITIFTNEGEYIGRYGGLGTQLGAVAFPTDIATNGDGKIFVVEREGRRLQIFEERMVVMRRGRRTRQAADPYKEKVRRDLADFMKEMQR
jgi:DNA-binding beta-propeller fold protein YncE